MTHLRHAYVPDGPAATATTDPEIYITVQHKVPGQPIKRVMRQIDLRMLEHERSPGGTIVATISAMLREIGT